MKTVNGIFKLMMGTSAIILSIAVLAYSTKSVMAEPANNSESYMLPQTNNSGKYTVAYNTGMDGNDKFYWHLTIANTETGKFKIFRWDRDDQGWKDNFGKQAPELP